MLTVVILAYFLFYDAHVVKEIKFISETRLFNQYDQKDCKELRSFGNAIRKINGLD
jgi:hypothetical protein